jgi:hypothetical protein
MTDRWTCPGCRETVALTSARRLRAHDDPRTSQPCPGKGFCIDEPEYPQLIQLWGWKTGIQLMKKRSPLWMSPPELAPHSRGALQKIVMKAYPTADAFNYTRPPTGPDDSITFCVRRRWHFAAPDGHVGEGYASRSDAADAFDEHMKEN